MDCFEINDCGVCTNSLLIYSHSKGKMSVEIAIASFEGNYWDYGTDVTTSYSGGGCLPCSVLALKNKCTIEQIVCMAYEDLLDSINHILEDINSCKPDYLDASAREHKRALNSWYRALKGKTLSEDFFRQRISARTIKQTQLF